MEVQYTPELRAYMEKTGKKTILVELVEINNSDFEITEFHVRFVDSRIRSIFLEKKKYRLIETEMGEILLPRFPLQLEDTVTFGLRSVLFFKQITYKGIKV